MRVRVRVRVRMERDGRLDRETKRALAWPLQREKEREGRGGRVCVGLGAMNCEFIAQDRCEPHAQPLQTPSPPHTPTPHAQVP